MFLRQAQSKDLKNCVTVAIDPNEGGMYKMQSTVKRNKTVFYLTLPENGSTISKFRRCWYNQTVKDITPTVQDSKPYSQGYSSYFLTHLGYRVTAI
jgi:hypothetical protein